MSFWVNMSDLTLRVLVNGNTLICGILAISTFGLRQITIQIERTLWGTGKLSVMSTALPSPRSELTVQLVQIGFSGILYLEIDGQMMSDVLNIFSRIVPLFTSSESNPGTSANPPQQGTNGALGTGGPSHVSVQNLQLKGMQSLKMWTQKYILKKKNYNVEFLAKFDEFAHTGTWMDMV